MGAILPSIVSAVVPFLLVLTLVVTIHELGHFLTARAFGIAVDRFSIGFGKAIASWKDRSGVEWRIGWIPLGGYVRFRGDGDASSSVPDGDDLADLRSQIVSMEGEASVKRYFHFRPIWQRALVVFGGPAANFVLAIVLFAGILMAFGSDVVTPRIGVVQPGGVAARAGVLPGDVVTAVNGRAVDDFTDLAQTVQLSAGAPLRLQILRGGQSREVNVTPERGPFKDPLTGRVVQVGRIGIGSSLNPADVGHRRYSPLQAAIGGVKKTSKIVETTVVYIGRVFRGRESGDQLSGPVSMARMSDAIAKASTEGSAPFAFKVLAVTVNLLSLAAVLSVGLGFMNLMPVPVLDGGHLVFYAVEAATRRPLDARIQAASYRVGLALLLGLMVFVTFNDLRQLALFKMIGGLFS